MRSAASSRLAAASYVAPSAAEQVSRYHFAELPLVLKAVVLDPDIKTTEGYGGA